MKDIFYRFEFQEIKEVYRFDNFLNFIVYLEVKIYRFFIVLIINAYKKIDINCTIRLKVERGFVGYTLR